MGAEVINEIVRATDLIAAARVILDHVADQVDDKMAYYIEDFRGDLINVEIHLDRIVKHMERDAEDID